MPPGVFGHLEVFVTCFRPEILSGDALLLYCQRVVFAIYKKIFYVKVLWSPKPVSIISLKSEYPPLNGTRYVFQVPDHQGHHLIGLVIEPVA